MKTVRLVALSDTHSRHDDLEVPDGDVLIHAGDIGMHGGLEEVEKLDRFLGRLPHEHKIVIAGNHDFCFENQPEEARARLQNAIYLEDSGVEVAGLRFWGSPWQPWFFDWAFNLPRGPALAKKWALVPTGVDVLITHGPPFGILDRTRRGEHVGCRDLRQALPRIRPRVHVFGHIHEDAGRHDEDGTIFLNASICTVRYEPTQSVRVVSLSVDQQRSHLPSGNAETSCPKPGQ